VDVLFEYEHEYENENEKEKEYERPSRAPSKNKTPVRAGAPGSRRGRGGRSEDEKWTAGIKTRD
jgi:hypothetical protein